MSTIAPALTRRLTTLPRITAGAVLSWIVEADRRYRDKRQLESLSEERLADVGLSGAPEHLIGRRR